MPHRTPPTVETRQGNICQWCGATVVFDTPNAKRIRRRWVAAIAAVITFGVTQVTENAIIGETIADLFQRAVQ